MQDCVLKYTLESQILGISLLLLKFLLLLSWSFWSLQAILLYLNFTAAQELKHYELWIFMFKMYSGDTHKATSKKLQLLLPSACRSGKSLCVQSHRNFGWLKHCISPMCNNHCSYMSAECWLRWSLFPLPSHKHLAPINIEVFGILFTGQS